jgi:enhancing lycopene biosynthesis protein 2
VARLEAADVYRGRLAELALLAAAKITDLMRPGQGGAASGADSFGSRSAGMLRGRTMSRR